MYQTVDFMKDILVILDYFVWLPTAEPSPSQQNGLHHIFCITVTKDDTRCHSFTLILTHTVTVLSTTAQHSELCIQPPPGIGNKKYGVTKIYGSYM